MKVLHTIRETPPNKNGMCALSTDSDHCYLAYPGHSTVGELQIFDALNLVSEPWKKWQHTINIHFLAPNNYIKTWFFPRLRLRWYLLTQDNLQPFSFRRLAPGLQRPVTKGLLSECSAWPMEPGIDFLTCFFASWTLILIYFSTFFFNDNLIQI